jgi:hypothetical protein
MARCVLCSNWKEPRECKLQKATVCRQCCERLGEGEKCHGCSYNAQVPDVRHNYKAVPQFSTRRMNTDSSLQAIAYSIESILCLWDKEFDSTLNDKSALSVLEKLLDRHYFKKTVTITEEPIRTGYEMVSDVIENDLSDVPEEILAKILGVIYFVARRRAKGGRDYFDLIHTYMPHITKV